MATCQTAPILNRGAHMVRNNNLPELAHKIRALRALSKETSYSLNRTIGEMLDKLSPDELVKLGELFMSEPVATK